LIAVFWLLSILGLALFSALKLIEFESDLAASRTGGTQAAHFAEMGLAVGANPVVERSDPLLRQVFDGGTSGFDCEIGSEADKFDINLLLANQNPDQDDKGWLRELFTNWGMEVEAAQSLVDALIDWTDEGDLEEMNGAELPYYEERGYPNRPFNRPFYSLDEMRLVRGMDLLEQANPDWKEYFTIWTQTGIDLNEAPVDRISRALQIPYGDAEIISETVRGPDGIRGTEDDLPFRSLEEAVGPSGVVFMSETELALVQHRVTTQSDTVRLASTGWYGDVKRRLTLILRNREATPTLLDRREEIVQ
jgi:hypothetical protein